MSIRIDLAHHNPTSSVNYGRLQAGTRGKAVEGELQDDVSEFDFAASVGVLDCWRSRLTPHLRHRGGRTAESLGREEPVLQSDWPSCVRYTCSPCLAAY